MIGNDKKKTSLMLSWTNSVPNNAYNIRKGVGYGMGGWEGGVRVTEVGIINKNVEYFLKIEVHV